MEMQQSHIGSDESMNMSSGFPKNSNTSCSTDLNNTYNRINVNNAISTESGGIVLPRNRAQVNQMQKNNSNTIVTAAAAAVPAPAPRDFNSGVSFTTSAPSGGSRDFRGIEHTTTTCSTTSGDQGYCSQQQSNLFTTSTTSSSSIVDQIKTRDPNSGLHPEQECSGSGINLACSETGSNLGEEDNGMDTGSVYSFRSDMDQGSSCPVNGSQCSDSTGLHPTSSSSMPRRTKNGILLRDRTNR